MPNCGALLTNNSEFQNKVTSRNVLSSSCLAEECTNYWRSHLSYQTKMEMATLVLKKREGALIDDVLNCSKKKLLTKHDGKLLTI